jgi:hypothetical protein
VILPDQAVRILIATKPVDFRKGHDGLAAMAHSELGFGATHGDTPVFFEFSEEVLDQVTPFIRYPGQIVPRNGCWTLAR